MSESEYSDFHGDAPIHHSELFRKCKCDAKICQCIYNTLPCKCFECVCNITEKQ